MNNQAAEKPLFRRTLSPGVVRLGRSAPAMKMPPLPELPHGERDPEAIREYAQAYGQAVREACAKVCDAVDADEQDEPAFYGFAKECAEVIRKGGS